MMSAEAALAHYEAVRHRLPKAHPGGGCLSMDNLLALADSFDAFLLDAFGVLNIGEEAIPGAPERIAALQAAGKRVLVVTNAASVPRDALVAKYRRLGYDFAPADVISSREVLLSDFRAQPGQRWGVMAPPELQGSTLDELPCVFLDDDPRTYGEVDGFLLLGSGGWTQTRQDLLATALTSRPRPLLVGNPDIVAPRAGGFSVEPGFYAHEVADEAAIEPRFYGKPFRDIYEHAFARLGPEIARDRIVMVGDSLHTDILGAQAAGIASALVTGFGFLSGCDALSRIAATGIAPDFLLARP